MLIVAPAARRRGAGRALLSRAEQAARDIGRSLLTLEARGGTPGETLIRAAGWMELGTLPSGALGPDREPAHLVHFWKKVSA
jgi:GNAT superfamily N-acetyltransferase